MCENLFKVHFALMQNEPKNQVQAEEFFIPIKIGMKTDLKTPPRTVVLLFSELFFIYSPPWRSIL